MHVAWWLKVRSGHMACQVAQFPTCTRNSGWHVFTWPYDRTPQKGLRSRSDLVTKYAPPKFLHVCIIKKPLGEHTYILTYIHTCNARLAWGFFFVLSGIVFFT